MSRVLVVRIGAIGDVAMALPMITAIRARQPDAQVTWLCGEAVAPLLKLAEGIDGIVCVDEKKLFGPSWGGRLEALASVYRHLAWRHFDRILLAHGDRRYRLLVALTAADELRGFSGRYKPVPGRHHSVEYVRLVTGRDGPEAAVPVWPKLKLPADDTVSRLVGTDDRPLILLAPGGAQNVLRSDAQRRWPASRYAELAAALLKSGLAVAIAGGAGDDYVRPAFAGMPVLDLIGRTSLVEYLQVLSAAELAVSHDTSAIHLAHLVQTPVVALFGPTNIHEKLYPDGVSRGLWGGEGLPCRPCYDGRNYHDCRSIDCMSSISTMMVLAEIQVLLAGRRGSDRRATGYA